MAPGWHSRRRAACPAVRPQHYRVLHGALGMPPARARSAMHRYPLPCGPHKHRMVGGPRGPPRSPPTLPQPTRTVNCLPPPAAPSSPCGSLRKQSTRCVRHVPASSLIAPSIRSLPLRGPGSPAVMRPTWSRFARVRGGRLPCPAVPCSRLHVAGQVIVHPPSAAVAPVAPLGCLCISTVHGCWACVASALYTGPLFSSGACPPHLSRPCHTWLPLPPRHSPMLQQLV